MIKEKKLALIESLLKRHSVILGKKDNKIYFLDQKNNGFSEDNNDVLVNKMKLFLKKNPRIFSIITKILTPCWGNQNSKKIIKNIPAQNVILNLGSGVTSIRPDVINVDFYPFENVDVVADISDLPFEDRIADVVICDCVLEHVAQPNKVIHEIIRVAKPNALVFVVVPFVFGFHSSPHDYYRWSKMGLVEAFKDFKEIETGIYFGPGHAVNSVFSGYLSTILSFGIKGLQQILSMVFLVLLVPLNYLDILLNRFKTSENIASHIYFVGRKI